MLLKITTGSTTIKHNFPDDASLQDLMQYIEGKTGMLQLEMTILVNFPPSPISVTSPDQKLTALGITSGSLITVRSNAERKALHTKLLELGFNPSVVKSALRLIKENDIETCVEVCQQISEDEQNVLYTQTSSNSQATAHANASKLERKIIPADNSCLFNAIGELLEYPRYDKKPSKYREMVADYLDTHRDFYTADMLDGKDIDEYIKWIRNKDKWGGEIEVSILAKLLGVEIAVVDIRTTHTLIYGQDMQYDKRIFLLYDGVHYDALVRTQGQTTVCSMLSVADQTVCAEATQLAKELQNKKQFVNLASGEMLCGVCMSMFAGEKEAIEHAKVTGHQNFSLA
ncbi:hypothetical protein EON65_47555 [archaeon]|nr:MAG: hypothetical protein EON65_47555 [archaeon]